VAAAAHRPPGRGGGVVHGPMWASALAGYVSASASMEEGTRTCGIGMQRCVSWRLALVALGMRFIVVGIGHYYELALGPH
jgi:hypothetical protein